MDLNDYFDPVSLEKPEFSLIREVYTFSHSITINTPDTPIRDIGKYDIALMGVREDKNAFLKGAASGPDAIREKLYMLGYVNKKVKIIDLGNLKITGNINDTYFALRDILHELVTAKVIPVIFGGSQDLTYGLSLAFSNSDRFWNLSTLDSKLDFDSGKKTLSSENYLDTIFRENKHNRLNYINIGHQLYFIPLKMLDKLENEGYESIRLGAARTALHETEPVMRDTHILSIDMSCVRQSDAPGASIPTPNGFFGHELCQMTRYAGASDHLKAIGFFEISPEQDINNHTAHLAAQATWYFI
ncbi:MAG TPA: formimidoylglutamase, partial [Bacteroidales bacterium]|nr:formimidoylglutamase [Bacteroidales bacterium]